MRSVVRHYILFQCKVVFRIFTNRKFLYNNLVVKLIEQLYQITHQLNLHCEKSISGWAFMNSLSFYCLDNSSLVGNPCCFCLISNIIFYTVERVSPSRSESLDGSGLIFCVFI